ncbi:MAG: peptidoglycan-binding protein [Desulfotomaculaceae bacterium]|nr:peptidoglycan-binding protein [Desulfotomaculaceae bacterium]
MKSILRVLTFCLVTSMIFFFQSSVGFAEQIALKEGMSGDSVLRLQQKLRDLGYYQGVPDGSFGPGTHSAVTGYQSANEFTVDGIAGAGTLGALGLLGSEVSSGSNSSAGETSVLKVGVSGDRVLKLQQQLRDLGYYQGTPDGSFGPATHSAVASYQSANNLTVDGIAGAGTLGALGLLGSEVTSGSNSTAGETSVLKVGVSGDRVLILQQKLSELGYYQGTPDGSFGSGTRSAVTNFQYDNKLTVDGIAGDKTLLALQSANPQVALANRGQALDRDAQVIVAFAKQHLGVPYVWAGQGPSGFDCSGFTYYVFNHFNIDLPRMANEQFYAGSQVSKLQPGDLVFFTTYEPGPSHVGIFIGDDQFIHASSGAGEVTITSLSEAYYQSRYLGARRYIG